MTDAEIRKLYTQCYCSKEAGALGSLITKGIPYIIKGGKAIPQVYRQINTKLLNLWKNLGKKRGVSGNSQTPPTPNTPPQPNTPPTPNTPPVPNTPSAPNTPPKTPNKIVDFAKKHPVLTTAGVVAGSTLGAAGYKTLSAQADSNGWERIKRYINENPEKVALIAGGLLTAPFWMPPLVNAFSGTNSPYSGYQMGRYNR